MAWLIYIISGWGKGCTFSQSFFIRSSPNLQVPKTGVKSQMHLNSSQIGRFTSVLRIFEHWKTFSLTKMKNGISALTRSLSVRSLSNLQVTRTDIKSQTRSNSGLIRPVILELFALDCWKSPKCHCSGGHSPFIFYWIFVNLADNLSSIKSHRCSKLGQSGLFTSGLPALIAENTIFDRLCMLYSDEWLLLFGRLVKTS